MYNPAMDLAELLSRGRVWLNLDGDNAFTAIRNAVKVLKKNSILSMDISADQLVSSTIAREKKSSTGMGEGIAFPHPAESLAVRSEDSLIALFYPAFPVDWESQDNQPVRAFFLLVSSNPKDHLGALSRLARICCNDGFKALLNREAGEEEILAWLRAYPGQ